jgi:hypothetical protein
MIEAYNSSYLGDDRENQDIRRIMVQDQPRPKMILRFSPPLLNKWLDMVVHTCHPSYVGIDK